MSKEGTMQLAPTDIKSRKKNPRDSYKFWQKELVASQKRLRRWQKQGNRIVERFIDARADIGQEGIERIGERFRINLFFSNTKTLQDMLYSDLPKIETSRTNADSADDVARVAAEMAERVINLDLADHGGDYDATLKACLQDRLLPGLGVARVRYEFESEEQPVAAVIDPMTQQVLQAATTQEVTTFEDAPVDYVHWQDVLWGWGRNWKEIPWIAFRAYLSKDEMEARFGAKIAKDATYKTQKVSDGEDDNPLPEQDAPWQKCEVWEIWDKSEKNVRWYSEGLEVIADKKADPLKLSGFYPCPPFLLANPTTTLFKPTPDYHLCQDLYNEVDNLQTRIAILTEAVKVVGVYNASATGIERVFDEGIENDLIPVDGWAMFAESGGLRGNIEWVPVQDIVSSLDKLIQLRDQTIQLLQQVSGMADIMRGSVNPYEGVGQTQIKAQFGSIRVQSASEQFARFVGDLMQLKLEVICRHFDPATIVQNSNMQFSPDAELIPQAVMLLKQPEMAHLRIKVKPEAVALEDFARLKVERTEFLTALATFMQSAAPMLETEPDAMPYLLKMLQWTLSGFKGSQEIEGVMDKAIEGAIAKAQQAAQNPQPTEEDQQAKAEQAKLQGELQKIQAKGQADVQMRQADLQADMQTAQAAHQAKMAEIAATHQARMTEIITKAQADQQKAATDLEANVTQSVTAAQAESEKDEIAHEMELEKMVVSHELDMEGDMEKSLGKIEEIGLQSTAKIEEMISSAALKPEKEDGSGDTESDG
jgi:hypothetical protein